MWNILGMRKRRDPLERARRLGPNRQEEVVAECREALRLKPGNADAYHLMGLALHSLNRLDEAAPAFEQAIHLQPGQVSGHSGLGIVRSGQGDFAAAAQSFQRVTELHPSDTGAWQILIPLFGQLGQEEQALATVRKALEANPGNPQLLCTLGNLLKKNGDTDAASQAYRDAAREDTSPYWTRGGNWLQRWLMERTFRRIGEPTRLSGRSRAHFLRGSLFAETGRQAEAREEWLNALRLAWRTQALDPANAPLTGSFVKRIEKKLDELSR